MDKDDEHFLQLAFAKKNALALRPLHTRFRVFSIITFELKDGSRGFCCGTNTETTFIGMLKRPVCCRRTVSLSPVLLFSLSLLLSLFSH
jgi:hypothetical protein